jgi:hypothetical protein
MIYTHLLLTASSCCLKITPEPAFRQFICGDEYDTGTVSFFDGTFHSIFPVPVSETALQRWSLASYSDVLLVALFISRHYVSKHHRKEKVLFVLFVNLNLDIYRSPTASLACLCVCVFAWYNMSVRSAWLRSNNDITTVSIFPITCNPFSMATPVSATPASAIQTSSLWGSDISSKRLLKMLRMSRDR